MYGDKLNISCTGLMDGSPNYGMKAMKRVDGRTYQRNPYMATFAINALYYKGIGSGIVRILAEYPDIR